MWALPREYVKEKDLERKSKGKKGRCNKRLLTGPDWNEGENKTGRIEKTGMNGETRGSTRRRKRVVLFCKSVCSELIRLFSSSPFLLLFLP